jgi:hypothetical protein
MFGRNDITFFRGCGQRDPLSRLLALLSRPPEPWCIAVTACSEKIFCLHHVSIKSLGKIMSPLDTLNLTKGGDNILYDLKDKLDIIESVYDALMKKGSYEKVTAFAKKYGL